MNLDRELLQLLVTAEPLGPEAHERDKNELGLEALLYDRIAIFTDVSSKPHKLYLGRKGAGKSALLRHIRHKSQFSQRKSVRNAPAAVTVEKNHIIYINSWTEFQEIVGTVHSQLKALNTFEHLLPPEFYTELWYQQLWMVVFEDIAKKSLSDTLLAPVEKFLEEPPTFHGPSKKHVADLFGSARDAVIRYFERKSARLYILFDSMDDYPVRDEVFQKVVAGLFQALTKINDDSAVVNVSFCIPEEIEPFMTINSANLLKDFNASYRIRWTPIDLIRIVAHRLRLSASFHDKKLHEQLSDLDFAKRDDLHHLFNLVLPKKVTNSRGTEEDPLAYIIRHTQLLPRHTLAIFNAALNRHYSETRSFKNISEQSIREGIKSVEKLISGQILAPYKKIYPKLLAACQEILPDLDPICSYQTLRKAERRFTKRIESEIASVWHTLFDIGIIGRSTGKTSSDDHQISRDERYCYGQFHFNVNGNFGVATDGEYCFHPVFSRHFALVRRNGDKRVVYPADINLENIYNDD